MAVLDWLWPFPLGIIFGGLLFLIAVGSWLALRGPAPPDQPVVASKRGGEPNAPALAPPAQPVEPSETTEPATPPPSADKPPVRSSPARTAVASTTSPVERTARAPAPKPRTARAPSQPVRDVVSAARPAPAKPQVEATPVSKPTPAPAASALSPAQEAELNDKLTLGRFFMDREDYRAALTQFQAALEIDSSNRAAQAALQQARDALKALESTPQP